MFPGDAMPAFAMSCPRCREAFPLNESNGHHLDRCPQCGGPLDPPVMITEPAWYYARDRQKVGPLVWEHLHRLAASGQLRPGDMVLREGSKRWVLAGSLAELFLTDGTVDEPVPLAQPVTDA